MMAVAQVFDDVKELLAGARHVVVTGHERADGDAVGAVGAMRRHLENEGKQVLALLSEPISHRYAFMAFAQRYEVYEPARHDAAIESCDVFIMCDLSSTSRLGRVWEPVTRGSARVLCIDHHPCEGDPPGDVALLDERATATGRLVWDYLGHVGATIDREIAESVFVSLCTDTGWFRYSNTTPDVLELAAELARYRLDLALVYRSIYQANSAAMLRLLGQVVRSMIEECEGRFVWTRIRRELMDDLGVVAFDADPILDVLRSGDRVEAVALFVEQRDGRVAVNLRSRPGLDVNRVARRFGGGGHAFAAGTTLPAEGAEDTMRSLVAALRHAMEDRMR